MHLTTRYLVLPLLILTLLSSNTFAQKTFYNDKVKDWQEQSPPSISECYQSIFLIGDVKHPATNPYILKELEADLKESVPNTDLFILGDIIYPKGLADEEANSYEDAKADLDKILSLKNSFQGDLIMIPGNHDWDRGGNEGYERMLNLQNYIDSLHNESIRLYPQDACPGPVELEISNDIIAILFDSQWWFQKYEKPGPEDGCDFTDLNNLFIQIQDILRRNEGKKIIFAAHHPLSSVGNHGGHFSVSQHFFPLRAINPALYIPLPGFIEVWYRKYLGDIQDIAHPDYKHFRNQLLSAFKEHPDVIYTAGHEHNLQYVYKDGLHHVISGGGALGTYISRRPNKTDFAAASSGYSRLNFYKNGEVWVDYYACHDETKTKIFSTLLYTHTVSPKDVIASSDHSYQDSTVVSKLTDRYEQGPFIRFWMGDNYREQWKTPVKLEVFDIGSEHGGLEILKRGGGQQTRSIRMEAKDEKQYVLRSVNKYVGKALDEELRNTIAEDVVQDGISASNPYAALTVPPLANAAGVMHTNPQIVWVPDDPNLGIYQKDLADGIYLYEERPNGDCSDMPNFGNSDKILGTPDLIKKTQEKHNHLVDQEAVVNARLLDIFMNDWDRHDDQWRWARFDENNKKIYRPIPRDRDQVFFVNEGVLMWLVKQEFILPKFQGFDYEVGNVKGLGFNARYFDRAFITEPDLETWLAKANQLQKALTDSVIHESVSRLPDEIYAINGKEIEAMLKSRREQIPEYAEAYYRFLAREVDVVATKDRDLFEIKRLPNGNTVVDVYELSDKKGKKKDLYYHREFKYDETREIRLYGLNDDDKFIIKGEAPKAIKIRLIGGKNNDTIIDRSDIKGAGKTVFVYDRKDKKNFIDKGKEVRLCLSKDKSVDNYNRKQYKYDRSMPLIAAGYNVDDGVFIGGGMNIQRFNFRDSSIQRITGKLAFQTGAFGIDYYGLFSSSSSFFDYVIDASVSMPRNVDNFFGMGNETVKETDDKSYYRVRYQYAFLNPSLKHTVSKRVNYSIGAYYQFFSVTDTNGRYISDWKQHQLDSLSFRRHHYTGLNASLEIDTRNHKMLPERGIYWVSNVRGFYGLNKDAHDFVRIDSDLRMYFSFRHDPRFVIALRFGGAANIGDYEFFHANTLGGKTNLRGFQSRRFAGDQSFYQSTEIRLKVFKLKNYIFNGQTGIYAFNDNGRVWLKGESSNKWHSGYGFGIWFAPFEFTALTLSYNTSDDDKMFVFNFRFLF